jgi:ABC-2 type transport system permease protein
LRSHEILLRASRAPWRPLLLKEVQEVVSGRALWIMLLILCPLVGYSFFQAVSLYGEASAAVQQSPVLATELSPLDGVLVPTFGSFYVAVTLLFPFVAIRTLGREKESGALRLLVQLPYGTPVLIAAKLVAVMVAWGIAFVPVASSLAIWKMLSGHLYAPETLNLIFGHALYGLLVGSIAVFAAAVSEGAATAAIIALAFTIGSWVLDFTVAGRPGLLDWISRLSLTQTLRPFEQGLFSASLAIGMMTVIAGFAALAAIWLPPGTSMRRKTMQSVACGLATAALVMVAALARFRSTSRRIAATRFRWRTSARCRNLGIRSPSRSILRPRIRATQTWSAMFCRSWNARSPM